MELPVEIEEAKSVFSMAKSTVEVIRNLLSLFKGSENYSDDEDDENGDREDCIKEAILILRKETQAKKIFHVEKFVENTLLNPECELKSSTIFFLLKDIEQMTWRQFCLLEGFRRKDSNKIEISPYGNSGINGISIETEIKKLIDLNYLHSYSTKIRDYMSTSFENIYISGLGTEISSLLDLQSVENSEIGKAFGKGRIKETVTY
jgi:hypothetical protein